MTNPLPLLAIDPETGAAVLTVNSIRGEFNVLVDIDDWPRVSSHKWYAEERAYQKTGAVYFISKIGSRTVQLHRFILKAPRHRQVDFVNPSATLDCRRQNLRFATITQQARNRRKFAPAHSQYKGVSINRRDGCLAVTIRTDEGRKHRYFPMDQEEQAARAYDELARHYHGAFACLNFPS